MLVCINLCLSAAVSAALHWSALVSSDVSVIFLSLQLYLQVAIGYWWSLSVTSGLLSSLVVSVDRCLSPYFVLVSSGPIVLSNIVSCCLRLSQVLPTVVQ